MIAQLAAGLRTKFAERECDADVVVGKDHPARHDRACRVCLVADAFAYEPADRVGGNPRSIATEARTIQFHVHARAVDQQNPDDQHAADLEACDLLASLAVASLESLASGAYVLGSGQYGGEELTNGYGVLKIFPVTFRVPVLDQTFPLTLDGTTGEATHKATFPAGDETVLPQPEG